MECNELEAVFSDLSAELGREGTCPERQLASINTQYLRANVILTTLSSPLTNLA